MCIPDCFPDELLIRAVEDEAMYVFHRGKADNAYVGVEGIA